jgi:hypothetical protein
LIATLAEDSKVSTDQGLPVLLTLHNRGNISRLAQQQGANTTLTLKTIHHLTGVFTATLVPQSHAIYWFNVRCRCRLAILGKDIAIDKMPPDFCTSLLHVLANMKSQFGTNNSAFNTCALRHMTFSRPW